MNQFMMSKIRQFWAWLRPVPEHVGWIPRPDTRTRRERAMDEVIKYLDKL